MTTGPATSPNPSVPDTIAIGGDRDAAIALLRGGDLYKPAGRARASPSAAGQPAGAALTGKVSIQAISRVR
jgi:hypothetical protein